MDRVKLVDILLIEDSSDDAELALRAIRKSRIANRIVWVKDGVEALDYLLRRERYSTRDTADPRLIFLDLHLPKLEGVEVLAEMKTHLALQSIPVVLMTSSDASPDISACYALGVNGHILKPIDFKRFSEAVSHAGLYWGVLNTPSPLGASAVEQHRAGNCA